MLKALLLILVVLVVGALLIALIVVGMYNRLVTLRNRYKNAFSQIDVQLKRRYDLIPNLVEIAKGYIKHERETLEAVIKARNAAYAAGQQAAHSPGDPAAMTALGGAEGQLTGALGRLFAVAEAYPDLKANQNMLALQEELSTTENKIAFARQAFNDAGDGLQHPATDVPDGGHRLDAELPRRHPLRGGTVRGTGGPQGVLHLSGARRDSGGFVFGSFLRTRAMAMDFFENQDHARRQTTRLLVMFALAVAVIILAIYLVGVLVLGKASQTLPQQGWLALWNPELLVTIAGGTILVVSLGSLYKISQLAAGGEVVAQMLGGRLVDPQTIDLAERRLLNVVEEMALAAGIPVPPVYILDNEPGINAFAAGHEPSSAVVAVSRGGLECLTREELQGVMGHEFSHILNGDMRLNLRLIGIVHGILILTIIGYFVMRSAGAFSSSSSRDSDRKGDSGTAIFLLGLALYILGYLGVLLGNLIKSAISRQREFLADASAVQFTRYPGGIAGALKKIGGLSEGSRIGDAHAVEVSHMFFGDAFAGSFFHLFATHPPLIERIRRLEPNFDGQFPATQPLAEMAAGVEVVSAAAASASAALALDSGAPSARSSGPRLAPTPEQLPQAGRLVAALPPQLVAAAREPFTARAVICGLLLSRTEEGTRTGQLQLLQQQGEPLLYRETQRLAGLVHDLRPGLRLPLADLTIPALKRLSPPQYAAFRQLLQALVAADGQVDLFEYCLQVLLLSYLDIHFQLKPPPTVRYRTLDAIRRPAAAVLSALAYAGQNGPEQIRRAFEAGAAGRFPGAELVPAEQCTLATFDAALGELAQSSPLVKRELLAAVLACIAADGKTTVKESELLRTISAALGCPLPPLALAADDA